MQIVLQGYPTTGKITSNYLKLLYKSRCEAKVQYDSKLRKHSWNLIHAAPSALL